MLRNYLIIAVRTLRRQKLYSSINVLSLSVGIACCALILLFVRHEWRADQFHENVDDIYRVYRVEHRVNGSTKLSAGLSTPLGPALIQELPNVKVAVRMRGGQAQVQRDNEVFVQGLLYAEEGFFSMFSFPFVNTLSATPLEDQQSIVLSTRLARRYFGDEDPVGQTLSLRLTDEFENFVVAAVVAPLPNNSSINFDLVVPYTRWPGYARAADVWASFNSAVYLQVAKGTDQATIQAQLDPLVERYYSDMIANAQASGWWVEGDDAFSLQVQPLREVHFSNGYTNMVASTGDPSSLYLLMGIGLLVLLLASVNFMTLAAGRATTRAREVGVRKALGAERAQLARQFWGEAMLLSGLALGVGVVLSVLILPFFNELAGARLGMENVDLVLVVGLVALTGVCGFAAGAYPALVLSNFQPTEALRGEIRHGTGISFSRALVVVQFAISIAMVASTLLMYDQLDYLGTKSLGFADSEIIAVDLQSGQTDEEQLLDRFRQRAEQRPDILNISGVSYAVGGGWSRTVMRHQDNEIIVYTMRTDPEYLGTMGMQLVAGRNFSESLETDREQAVLINETLARELGWDDPVGHILPGYEEDSVTIIGVVADFHFLSLRNEIEPAFLHMSPSMASLNFALLRIGTADVSSTLASLAQTWTDIAPDQPFIYEFLDQRLDALYDADRRWSRMVQSAAVFALLIACMGLFGLATLSVERRRKEVGLRKVLGASAPGIALLLSKDFARLVLIAFILACPPTYFIMSRWFDGFAYHTNLGVGVFLLAGGMALAVALLTISFQALKAALSDPVKSLRYE